MLVCGLSFILVFGGKMNFIVTTLQFGCAVEKSLEIDCYRQCSSMIPFWGMPFNIRCIEMFVEEIFQA